MKFWIIFLIILSMLFMNIDKEVYSVFNEDNSYDMYTIEFENNNVSTNNLEELFSNVKIIWLEPSLSVFYSDKMSYKYHFEDVPLSENIRRFKANIISKLYNYNYAKDAINYQILGIKIKRMKVYCSKEEISSLKIDGMRTS